MTDKPSGGPRTKSEVGGEMTAVRRPALRWHGGKFILANWIISHFPKHRIYVEPFGGAGSVLLKKERSYAEVFNDIDDNIYNFFWVIQNHYEELAAALRLTPFSRREFEISYLNHPNPIEKARRLVIRSFMGFGADSASNVKAATGFRANSNRSGSTPAHDWVSYEAHLHQIAERFRGVVLESRDAIEVIKAHDGPDSLIYLDPPYVPETRKRVGAYRHEFSESDHRRLIDAAVEAKGRVVISGYDNELYNTRLANWQKVSRKAFADGANERTEILWIKTQPQAAQREKVRME